MPGGFCCLIGVCCPPAAQAAALADHLGFEPAAVALVLERFALVPHNIDPLTPGGDPVPVSPRNERLDALHAHIRQELRLVLVEQGHQAG